jgi:hypothetical protein
MKGEKANSAQALISPLLAVGDRLIVGSGYNICRYHMRERTVQPFPGVVELVDSYSEMPPAVFQEHQSNDPNDIAMPVKTEFGLSATPQRMIQQLGRK